MTKANILGYLDEIIAEIKMSKDEVVLRVSEFARASPEAFMSFEGNTWKIDIAKAKRENKLHLIKSITPTRNGLKVEMHDPLRALELIGKHHDVFKEQVEHKGEITINVKYGLDS